MTDSKTTLLIEWAHTKWLLDNRRVLVNKAEKILILSDIHIGYYSSFREQGSYLPMYDIMLLQEAVQSILDDYSGYHWIIAGDIKHSHSSVVSAAEEQELKTILEAITERNSLTLIQGNHDRGLEGIIQDLDINCTLVPSYNLDNITITHNEELLDQPTNNKIIMGHVHPIISLEHIKGSFVPIFAVTEDVLILPAFNYVAGGYNINKLYYKEEKEGKRRNYSIYALGKQVYNLGNLEELVQR